jgi:hypothetical protein
MQAQKTGFKAEITHVVDRVYELSFLPICLPIPVLTFGCFSCNFGVILTQLNVLEPRVDYLDAVRIQVAQILTGVDNK